MRTAILFVATTLWLSHPPGACAQLASRAEPGTASANKPEQHRTRLYLKDGSYQIVMSYTIVGKNVRYISAERGGDAELIPLNLIDLDATHQWEARHPLIDPNAPPEQRAAPAIDPELLKEEADRALLAPEVAPDLRLAPEDAILALDTFRATPELVPLTQTDGELNKTTGHSILRGNVNPQAAAHQIVVLKGEKAPVQFHVDQPVFYLKLDDALLPGGDPLTVDTHGASSRAPKPKRENGTDFVLVRVDVRQDARVIASFNIPQLGTGKRQEDVFEADETELPGGHWLKVKPRESLLVGEYALVEIVDDKTINLGVWDFGIHPTAPENRDVLKPEKKRAITLEKRQPN